MSRYTLYVNFEDKVIERPLPAENNRKITIDITEVVSDCIIRLEIFDNIWTIVADENYSISIKGAATQCHKIEDGDVIKFVTASGLKFAVMVYEINENITMFTKYDIRNIRSIKIGKGRDNDIAIDNSFISTNHAVIENNENVVIYHDKSRNGSYVNGVRINRQCELKPLDIISTVGIKLVFLGDCIAINRKDIVVCNYPIYNSTSEMVVHKADNALFSRSPRTVEPLFDEVIEIEAPPAPHKQRNQPLIFVIGPSVTMPIPILFSTFINSQVNNSSSSYLGIIASVGMSALIGGGWAIAHYVYNNKTLKEDEELRVNAYKKYIQKNERLIKDKQNYDNSVLIGQFLSSGDIAAKLNYDNTFIWNRNINQDDFLSIRLGTGNVDFSNHIAVPKQRFSIHSDDIAELPHKLYEKYKYINSTVVTMDLKRGGIVGVLGTKEHMDNTARNIFVQISALHCYTDVRIAVFVNDHEYNEYAWVRWLPHILSEDMKLRMISSDDSSRQNVMYHIGEILRRRVENSEVDNNESKFYPHYIVYCTDRDIFDGDSIEKYIPIADKLGFTFILAYGKLDRLPNECCNIIQCDDDYSGYYNLKSKRGNTDKVDIDYIESKNAELYAKQVSRLRVRDFSLGEIPTSIDYFNMIGIGKLEHWDLIKNYKENRVYEGIRSFVGIGIGGKPMVIDLHEKKHGPHGLVAGTTGSGKSEALQTLILSLAMNYHPDEIAFILIDYKGGGMAFAFKGMPHIAGMITNISDENSESGELDSNITRRALVSIRSEIKHRQAVFNKYKVNHIDAYIRLNRDGTASEPLPHLVIISDEFAELKKEQPEFIKELVSTARVGRSLGIHLILATQKPGGVVDDEIRSNSRFKLCLRVQDKQDSNEMLRRPDAAYLTNSGRAYFQLGNDEVFEQFQTGYSGADYIPNETAGMVTESSLYMMNIDGTAAVSNERRSKKEKSGIKQLKAAVDYIIKTCEDNRIKSTRALWLEELSRKISLDEIISKYNCSNDGITAVLGVVDDPEHQRQFPAVIDLSMISNLMICGISGIGKTTMLQTMLISLMNNYSCEQLNYYILDFSSRTLKVFNSSMHCGLVAFSDDKEAVTRLFSYVNTEMNKRKGYFDSLNVGSYKEYIRIKKLPLQLIVIDNIHMFNELYPELSETFAKISRDCSKYGIQIIITCNNLSDIRYKVRQNFGNVLTLCVSEKADYREAWGVSADFVPKNVKGRGLILSDGHLLEYQTALPCVGDSEAERFVMISNIVDKINDRDKGLSAAEIVKTIPLAQTYDVFVSEYANEEIIPIGYNTDDISIYGLSYTKTF